MTTQNLKIMVICNDGRNDACVELLQQQVPEVYMLKAGRCRKFTSDEPKGLSIPRRQIPKSVDALLFHSTDLAFWKDVDISSSYTFEFNTPGTPQSKPGVIPIYRQTFPNFSIKSHDAEELIKFASGQQSQLPAMCQTPIIFDLIPALTTLCQSYVEESLDEGITTPTWWLETLGLMEQGQLDQDLCNQIFASLSQEYISVPEFQSLRDGIEWLLDNLLSKEGKVYQVNYEPIEPGVVKNVYIATEQLLKSDGAESPHIPDNELEPLSETILAIKGNFLGRTAAAVLARKFGLRQQILEPKEISNLTQLPNSATLILTNTQVLHLPALRLKNFNGAVLILSQESFASLKRQYRVLRFGQGSHDALAIPCQLSDLNAKFRSLVPMEPENLRFFQDEMRAIDSIYRQEIVPYLDKLERSTSNDEIDTATLARLIERMRSETPVACHTVVTIKNQTLQIQQHLHRALVNIENTSDLQLESSYLQAIFEAWYQLVRSAAGENLKTAA